MTKDTKHILKVIIRTVKTLATLLQKVLDGKGEEI